LTADLLASASRPYEETAHLRRQASRTGTSSRPINGLDISSAERGLEAYAKLRSAIHLSVGLERNGRRLSIEVDIR
jgi:hypothetical protein